jgi:Bacterial Ig-like domain (group 2)
MTKRRIQIFAVLMVLALFSLAALAYAGTITIPSGSSQSQIQTYLNSATSTNNVIQFQAGTYAVGSGSLTLPCVSGGVTITGPTVPLNYTAWHTPTYSNQTAILSSSSRGSPIFTVSNCTNPITIEYLQFSGAGALYISMPSTGITFQYNSVVDLPCSSTSGCSQNGADQGIYAYGNDNPASVLSNFTVQWNQFGDASSCLTPANIMAGTTDTGGLCTGTLIEGTANNVAIVNNSYYHLEEGTKYLCFGDSCNNAPPGAAPISPTWSNWTVKNNDYQAIHRMAGEFQPQGASNVVMEYNSNTAPYNPGPYSFGWSNACCDGNAPYGLLPGNVACGSSGQPACTSSTPATPPVPLFNYNVLVQNTCSGSACQGSYSWGYAVEWWGWGAQAIQNLVQGFSPNQIAWGAGSSPWEINYNTGCGPNASQLVVPEGYGNPAPSQTGNVYTSSCSAITTTAPTISPATGNASFPLTVTMTDAGNTSSTTPVPQGNVSIWYTTDGSTPAPNAGTSQLCNPTVGSTSCNIAVAAAGTVKAIGMWGQGANTYSYPSGYGFVPSSVASATYTGTSPPTLNSVSLSATGSVTSIAQGASVQINAACHYNNGTTTSCNTTDTYGNSVSSWNTSNTSIVTISGSGLATGVAIGSVNLTAVAGGVTSSPAFTLSVTPPSVTLSSVSLATTGGVTSIVASSTNQLIATCHYSDSSTTNCTTTDSHGNVVSTWNSSATTIATVSSAGLVTGVAAGSTNLSAVVAGITSSPLLTLSVTAAPPTLTGGYLGTPGSANTMTVGGTLQFSAYCQYSNSTTTNCSVADIYGNAVTQWLSSNTSEVTVSAVGSAHPGLATAVGAGSPNIQAYVGAVHLNEWVLYISNPTVSLTGVSLATTGGVTGLFVGQTNQLVATCTYSDGSTTNCTTTDSHGNVAGSYSSSSSGYATVSASTGLVTAVAAGTTNLTAQAGSFTSPTLALTVVALPTGIYTITISGPVKLSGTVSF